MTSRIPRARDCGLHIALVGVSHARAPVAVRERLHLDVDKSRSIALRLADAGAEAVVLSTCNRSEIYLALPDVESALALGRAQFERLVQPDALDASATLYELCDDAAASHLLRVAAGLESMIVGDEQILGQVRAAYRTAATAETTGRVLDRLFRQAAKTGKRVRRETELSAGPASVPAAAAEVVRRMFGEIDGRRIVIVGAGKMSGLAAADLVAHGAENILIVNRTIQRARELAARLGGRAAGFDQLGGELERADVVLCSTCSPQHVVTAEQVTRALGRRRGRPLLFIDIAVPRDIDPAVADLDGCLLFDIDDLGAVAGECGRTREHEVERALAIVSAEAKHFREWQQQRSVAPTIAALRQRAEEVRVGELERAVRRLGNVSSAERSALELLTSQIVNKLLHLPTIRLKQAAMPDAVAYAGALQALFDLDEVDG